MISPMLRAFSGQVAARPHATAVHYPGAVDAGEISYQALDERSDRLASHLSSLGVSAGGFVGVFFEPEPTLIVAGVSSVFNLITATPDLRFEPKDRVGRLSNPAFDAFTWETWGCLANAVPAVQWNGPRQLIHAYGPTETTTFATRQGLDEVGPGQSSLPIGTPLAGYQVTVWHSDGRPAGTGEPGEPGEPLIGGAGVAAGYLNRPELTSAKFGPPPSGENAVEPRRAVAVVGEHLRPRRLDGRAPGHVQECRRPGTEPGGMTGMPSRPDNQSRSRPGVRE